LNDFGRILVFKIMYSLTKWGKNERT